MRGATYYQCDNCAEDDSFNPRAREGRDSARMASLLGMRSVSIHAPVRGATQIKRYHGLTNICFNPRAREGRDHHPTAHLFAAQSFNPRAREGRDPDRSTL